MQEKFTVLKWGNNLSTGLNWQNEQHKTLVEQINKLVNQEDDTLDDILEFTKYYTATHFRDEEAMMVHYDYPALDAHIEEHGFFVNSMQEIFKENQKDKIKIRKILTELSAWLMWHIKNSDKEQADWLIKNTNIKNHQPTEFYEELENYRRNN